MTSVLEGSYLLVYLERLDCIADHNLCSLYGGKWRPSYSVVNTVCIKEHFDLLNVHQEVFCIRSELGQTSESYSHVR